MTRVKICGITNIEDAMAAVECGADAVGFVFALSPRRVDAGQAGRIGDAMPPFVNRVGVFVNTDPGIAHVAQVCGLDTVQLHGDQDESFARSLTPLMQVIRTLRVKCKSSLRALPNYASADAFLLDTFSAKAMGGTGKTFDWDLALAAKDFGKPIILSGGLTPDNVEEAVKTVRPYAIDVSSGVEYAPGKKDHNKIKELIANVRKADATA